jgi:hypothetical protein
MMMKSHLKTKLNLKKSTQYTFLGLVAGVLIVAALLLTYAIQIPTSSAALTSSKSIGHLGGGYSLVTDSNGTRIVYPYQVISYAPAEVASPRSLGHLGSGYSLVTTADGTWIIYPYLVSHQYPFNVATSSKYIGGLGGGYTLVNGPDGVHIIYPYQAKLYDQTPNTDSATVK